jgi:hypothetical protein
MWLWVGLAFAQVSASEESWRSMPDSKKQHKEFRYSLPYDYAEARSIWLSTMVDSWPSHAGSLTKKDQDGDGVYEWWDLCPYRHPGYDGAPEDARVGCPASAGWYDFGEPEKPSDDWVEAPPPPAAEDLPPTRKNDDDDGDGNENQTDACPLDPEDFDGFEDSDGCPDPDNDGDGILDSLDQCPSDPETVNGFNDEDGCVDSTLASLLGIESPPPPPAPQPAPQPLFVPAPQPVAVVTLPSIDGPLRTGASAPKDSAVVVGLEDYAFIADVPYARRDADAFQSFLLYSRGVPSHRIRNLTSGAVEHIRSAVEAAGRETGAGGRVWVYFAGHGAASPVTRERMLLGDDVRSDATSFEARAVTVSELEKLASVGGAEVVLVLDTCFAGVGRGGGALMANARFSVPAFVAPTTPTVWEWNAAGPNQLSGPLDEARHGAFTYFAVGALRGWADGELSGVRDGRVTAEEAQVYVTRALRARQVHDQAPVWVGLKGGAEVVLSTNATERGPGL